MVKNLPAMKEKKVKSLFVTLWTVTYKAPPSMGFSRQEQWSGLPFPSPEDLPDPGIKPESPALWADALPSEPPGKSNAGLEEAQAGIKITRRNINNLRYVLDYCQLSSMISQR